MSNYNVLCISVIFTIVFSHLYVFLITVPLSPGLQTHSPTHSPIPYYPTTAGFAEHFPLGAGFTSQSPHQLQCGGSPFI